MAQFLVVRPHSHALTHEDRQTIQEVIRLHWRDIRYHRHSYGGVWRAASELSHWSSFSVLFYVGIGHWLMGIFQQEVMDMGAVRSHSDLFLHFLCAHGS